MQMQHTHIKQPNTAFNSRLKHGSQHMLKRYDYIVFLIQWAMCSTNPPQSDQPFLFHFQWIIVQIHSVCLQMLLTFLSLENEHSAGICDVTGFFIKWPKKTWTHLTAPLQPVRGIFLKWVSKSQLTVTSCHFCIWLLQEARSYLIWACWRADAGQTKFTWFLWIFMNSGDQWLVAVLLTHCV